MERGTCYPIILDLTLSHNIMPIGVIVLSRSTITSWASFDKTELLLLFFHDQDGELDLDLENL